MFTEQYKDQVYFSDTLAYDKKYKAIYQDIVNILDANNVKHGLLNNTKDYWCRDYMPIQCGYKQYFQFRYHPDYLKKKRKYETPHETVVKCTKAVTGVEPFSINLIADGGNFTVCTSKDKKSVVVLTEKILTENGLVNKEAMTVLIGDKFLSSEILFLPWDTEDECGHTDGIVHNIGDGRVLVNLELYDKDIADEMRKRLETKFEVIDLKLSSYDDNSWAYINMIQTRDVIIVPALGLDTDKEALEQIKTLHPDYEDRIFMVNASSIIKDFGGALNCLSWTVSTQSSPLHHTSELDERFDVLLNKGKQDINSLTSEEITFLGDYDAPRLDVENHKLADLYFGY